MQASKAIATTSPWPRALRLSTAFALGVLCAEQLAARAEPDLARRPPQVRLRHDPVLGWTLGGVARPHLDDRPVLLVMGDDSTRASDLQGGNLCRRLQERLPTWLVLDESVPGYGVDQSYLLLQRILGEVTPNHVVFVVAPDDHWEARSTWRPGYGPKPLLSVEGGRLGLRGVPVAAPSSAWLAPRATALWRLWTRGGRDPTLAILSHAGRHLTERRIGLSVVTLGAAPSLLEPLEGLGLHTVSLPTLPPEPASHVAAGDRIYEAFARLHGEGPILSPRANSIGFLDGLDEGGNAFGWALDPDDPTNSSEVRFYLATGERPGPSHFLGRTHAKLPRLDVNEVTGHRGDHGFSFRLPPIDLEGTRFVLHAFSVEATGHGERELSHSGLILERRGGELRPKDR